jgi:hypothetical protein
MDNMATQTINKVEALIQTRIPFKQLEDFAKQKGSLDSFKSAERRIQKFALEFEAIKLTLEEMELEHKRT